MSDVFKTGNSLANEITNDLVGREFHDINSRQWFKVNKVVGDKVYMTSPYGFRMTTMDEFNKMVKQSPLNKPGTWTQIVVNPNDPNDTGIGLDESPEQVEEIEKAWRLG